MTIQVPTAHLIAGVRLDGPWTTSDVEHVRSVASERGLDVVLSKDDGDPQGHGPMPDAQVFVGRIVATVDCRDGLLALEDDVVAVAMRGASSVPLDVVRLVRDLGATPASEGLFLTGTGWGMHVALVFGVFWDARTHDPDDGVPLDELEDGTHDEGAVTYLCPRDTRQDAHDEWVKGVVVADTWWDQFGWEAVDLSEDAVASYASDAAALDDPGFWLFASKD